MSQGCARIVADVPPVFQDLIETVSPGPYLELFARRHRLGWDVWGNEVGITEGVAL